MTSHEHTQNQPLEEGRNPDGSPLYDDVNVSFIVMIGVISAIVTFVSIMAVQGLFFFMKDSEIRQKVYGKPVIAAAEIQKQRESLHGFHVSKKDQSKSISIELAMNLTVAKLKSESDSSHSDSKHGDSGHVDPSHAEPSHADSKSKSDGPKPSDAKPEETKTPQGPPADPSEEKDKTSTAAKDKAEGGNWTMWGGDNSRNMVNATTGIELNFDLESGKNVKWSKKLGSQTYGNPVVAGGKILVGTNNGSEYRPQHKGDRGVLLCFNEADGKFLWQLTREKLPEGRVHDWPEQGICSTPCVVEDRVYVVTNRCELMCLDLEGMHDELNDGDTNEADLGKEDADIVWKLDMIEELGVFPHNLATSSPLFYENKLYLLTSNGVDEAHLEIPAPRSPCFLCVDAKTGEVVWEDNTPFDQILHGQWSSPALGIVDGEPQVIMPGGDGWVYALNANTGEHIWKFDLNPKNTAWELGGRGDRNAIIGTPVFYDNSVVIAVGQDPEHGNGVGHLWKIDATKQGDVSAELGDIMTEGRPNPNSGVLWHYGGEDEDGSLTGKKGREIFRRTMSTVSIHDGLVYAADLIGYLHCIDFKTGKRVWEYDTFGATWGSPMYVDGHVLLGNEQDTLNIFKAGREEPTQDNVQEVEFDSSIYSTPTIANGMMYISSRNTLYAIKLK